jgi:hypothetical protein
MEIILVITTDYETLWPIRKHNIHWQTYRHVNSQQVTSNIHSTSVFKICNKRKMFMLNLCVHIWYRPSLHSKLLTNKNVLTEFLYICIIYISTKFHMTISNGHDLSPSNPKLNINFHVKSSFSFCRKKALAKLLIHVISVTSQSFRVLH